MVLKTLTALRGVSGDNGAVRDYILEHVRAHADEVHVDRVGNVIAHKKARGPEAGRRTHVLMAAHMDEVGLIVRGIHDNGLISYLPVGGIDPRVLVSKRVRVGKHAVPGVIGAKAIHLQTKAELSRVLSHDELYIDIGAKNGESAKKLVSPGDYASFDSEWVEFGDQCVKAKALDDRVGCMAMMSLLEGEYPVDLTCAFTIGEELGLRGATVVGHDIQADCAIVLEATSANDLGDVPEHEQVCRVGQGVAISFMDTASIAHRGLRNALMRLATEERIAWQNKRYVSGGNDAGALQTAGLAKATCVLSVPCRYIHSPSSVASLKDIEAQYLLAEAFLSHGAVYEEV